MKKVKVLVGLAVVAIIASMSLFTGAIAQPQEVNMGELIEGDLDGNSFIVMADFVAFKANYPCFSGCAPEDGDFDRNGMIVMSDFLLFKQNYPQFGINEI